MVGSLARAHATSGCTVWSSDLNPFVSREAEDIALRGIRFDPRNADELRGHARSWHAGRLRPVGDAAAQHWAVQEALRNAAAGATEVVCDATSAAINVAITAGIISALLPVFTVPKGSGGYRLVIDARPTNATLEPRRFRLDGIDKALRMCSPGGWLATLDLSSGYFHMPLRPSAAGFLAFIIGGVVYRFLVAPFGLSLSPISFYLVLRPVMRQMRAEGHRVVLWVDDFLVAGRTRAEADRALARLRELLELYGFVADPRKSMAETAQVAKFLGFVIDLERGVLRLPSDKRASYLQAAVAARVAARKGALTRRDVASLAGKLESASRAYPALRAGARALLRQVSGVGAAVPPSAWRRRVTLTTRALADLDWVVEVLGDDSLALESPAFRPPGVIAITADASSKGYGGHLGPPPPHSRRDAWVPPGDGASADPTWVGGLWTPPDAGPLPHIVVLEGIALLVALQHNLERIRGRYVALHTDSVWLRAALEKQGHDLRDLDAVVRAIHATAASVGAVVYDTSWVASEDNWLADALSRGEDTADFGVSDGAFERIAHHFGACETDVFAAPHNARCSKYFAVMGAAGAAPAPPADTAAGARPGRARGVPPAQRAVPGGELPPHLLRLVGADPAESTSHGAADPGGRAHRAGAAAAPAASAGAAAAAAAASATSRPAAPLGIPRDRLLRGDAFTQDWAAHGRLWIHPPLALLPRVLDMLQATGAEATVIAPVHALHWEPLLRDLSDRDPLPLAASDLVRGRSFPATATIPPGPWYAWSVGGQRAAHSA